MSILKKTAASKAGHITAVAALLGGTMIGLTASPAHAANPRAVSSPTTANAAGGAVLKITGKGFANTVTNAPLTDTVGFSTTECTSTPSVTTATPNVVSPTVLYVTTPALTTDTLYYVCVHATADDAVFGQATVTTGSAPTVTSLTPSAPSAPTKGGNKIVVTGTNFTSTTKVTLDGTSAKTTFGDATSLSVTLPAHAAGKDVRITVTSEFGSVTTSTDATSVDYYPSVTITPTYGDGGSNNWVSVKASGFSSLTFGTAVDQYVVAFVPGGVDYTAAGLLDGAGAVKLSATVVTVSDTQITCKVPASLSGAYSIMVLQRDGTTADNYGATFLPITRTGTYTASSM
jgi:hypothetical protein